MFARYHVFHLRPTALFFLELCEVSVKPLLHPLHSLSSLVSALPLTSAVPPVVWGKLLPFNTISSSSSASLPLPLWCRERKTRGGGGNIFFKAIPWRNRWSQTIIPFHVALIKRYLDGCAQYGPRSTRELGANWPPPSGGLVKQLGGWSTI